MSILKWLNPQVKKFENFTTDGSAVAVQIDATQNPKDPKTLYLFNIGTKEITPTGTPAKDVVRNYEEYARSQYALCALENTYAVPYNFVKKVFMVFTFSHFCCPSDSKASCGDRAILWAKDIARIIILPFAWTVLFATALFAAIYPSAGLRNAVATLESVLLENKDYNVLRAMTADQVLEFIKNNALKATDPVPDPKELAEIEKEKRDVQDKTYAAQAVPTVRESNPPVKPRTPHHAEVAGWYYPKSTTSSSDKASTPVTPPAITPSPSLSPSSSTPASVNPPVTASSPDQTPATGNPSSLVSSSPSIPITITATPTTSAQTTSLKKAPPPLPTAYIEKQIEKQKKIKKTEENVKKGVEEAQEKIQMHKEKLESIRAAKPPVVLNKTVDQIKEASKFVMSRVSFEILKENYFDEPTTYKPAPQPIIPVKPNNTQTASTSTSSQTTPSSAVPNNSQPKATTQPVPPVTITPFPLQPQKSKKSNQRKDAANFWSKFVPSKPNPPLATKPTQAVQPTPPKTNAAKKSLKRLNFSSFVARPSTMSSNASSSSTVATTASPASTSASSSTLSTPPVATTASQDSSSSPASTSASSSSVSTTVVGVGSEITGPAELTQTTSSVMSSNASSTVAAPLNSSLSVSTTIEQFMDTSPEANVLDILEAMSSTSASSSSVSTTVTTQAPLTNSQSANNSMNSSSSNASSSSIVAPKALLNSSSTSAIKNPLTENTPSMSSNSLATQAAQSSVPVASKKQQIPLATSNSKLKTGMTSSTMSSGASSSSNSSASKPVTKELIAQTIDRLQKQQAATKTTAQPQLTSKPKNQNNSDKTVKNSSLVKGKTEVQTPVVPVQKTKLSRKERIAQRQARKKYILIDTYGRYGIDAWRTAGVITEQEVGTFVPSAKQLRIFKDQGYVIEITPESEAELFDVFEV